MKTEEGYSGGLNLFFDFGGYEGIIGGFGCLSRIDDERARSFGALPSPTSHHRKTAYSRPSATINKKIPTRATGRV
jgi:hypothetical protein